MNATNEIDPVKWDAVGELGEETAPEDRLPPVEESFHVADEKSANWVIRHIADARARAVKAQEWAAREVAQAEREESWFLGRFGAELEAFTRSSLDGGKKKSLALPAGTIGFRKTPEKLVITDEAKCLEWARKNAPASVVVVPASERLSKSDLNLAVKANGVIPDGADIEPAVEKFYVR
jgi:phage host-nuclease inhibitor protein Gam